MILETTEFASHLLFATGIFGIGSMVGLRWMINRHEERIARRRKLGGKGGLGSDGLGPLSPYEPPSQLYMTGDGRWVTGTAVNPALQQNANPMLQGVLGAGAMQGVSSNLPYPYSMGYPTPGPQYYREGPLRETPDAEVEPIAGPMDAIINAKPRKMRLKEK